MDRLFACRGVVALAAVLLAAPAAAQPLAADKLDPVLRVRAGQLTGRSRVIVQFAAEPDVRAITSLRGLPGRRLDGPRAQVAEVDNIALSQLASDPRVARVAVDRPAFATLTRTGRTSGAVLAREQFGVTGHGVGVAVIDSGITAWHDDLYRDVERVVHFKDFTGGFAPNVLASPLPNDPYGHGTHVAGIIAGSGYDSDGARAGIAPGASLVGLKVLDGEGRGYVSDVIAAIDYAVSIRRTYNIRIINLSVGAGVYESYRTDPLAQAARRAVEADIVVVAAAGNLGQNEDGSTQFGGITSPGNAPWVLTVGAASHQGTLARSDDAVAAFSSRGPTWIDFLAKPDLVAPGVGIESLADPQSTLAAALGDYLLDGAPGTGKPYLSLSGSSMAAPAVSGAVALMLEANPRLTPNAVKAILQYTAQVLPGAHPVEQGAGLLNIAGAVRMARFFGEPDITLAPMADTIEGETFDWAAHLIWGNYRIAGGVPLPGSNAWSASQPWGALRTPQRQPVVWGARDLDNIVWSTRGLDNIVWSTRGLDNIVWSTRGLDNIVWSTRGLDNIVWSTRGLDNIVWSTRGLDNIVWSTRGLDNIVWSTRGLDNIVWSTEAPAYVVWPSQD